MDSNNSDPDSLKRDRDSGKAVTKKNDFNLSVVTSFFMVKFSFGFVTKKVTYPPHLSFNLQILVLSGS